MDKRDVLWVVIRVAGLVLLVIGVLAVPDFLTGMAAYLTQGNDRPAWPSVTEASRSAARSFAGWAVIHGALKCFVSVTFGIYLLVGAPGLSRRAGAEPQALSGPEAGLNIQPVVGCLGCMALAFVGTLLLVVLVPRP